MTDPPAWIQPGETATLIWYDAAQGRPDGLRMYQIAGPVFESPPRSPYFLLAPVEQSEFSSRLYRGLVGLPELRQFLDRCVLAAGEMGESLDFITTRVETPALPVLDAWRAVPARPLLRYLADITAFLPDDLPVYVTPEAYTAAQRAAESFATAWVCAECGQADDAAVFFWTVHRDDSVRVCFLIQNETGRWTCHLHPFEFARESACA